MQSNAETRRRGEKNARLVDALRCVMRVRGWKVVPRFSVQKRPAEKARADAGFARKWSSRGFAR